MNFGSGISCCIASSFYIKPQRPVGTFEWRFGCIASSFYIKPQHFSWFLLRFRVVLHPLSTSNHNLETRIFHSNIVVLHPLSTSNHNATRRPPERGTVVLHPLSTSNHNIIGVVAVTESCIASSFYIKPQHRPSARAHPPRCIASSFYIKPQHVVVRSGGYAGCIASSFYIKPQLVACDHIEGIGCIASSFYIKPQPPSGKVPQHLVVLHPLSTSNHNLGRQTL